MSWEPVEQRRGEGTTGPWNAWCPDRSHDDETIELIRFPLSFLTNTKSNYRSKYDRSRLDDLCRFRLLSLSPRITSVWTSWTEPPRASNLRQSRRELGRWTPVAGTHQWQRWQQRAPVSVICPRKHAAARPAARGSGSEATPLPAAKLVARRRRRRRRCVLTYYRCRPVPCNGAWRSQSTGRRST